MSDTRPEIAALQRRLLRQVLIFVDALQVSSLRGTPGKSLLEFAGTISSEDLSVIGQANESGCEQVDGSEW